MEKKTEIKEPSTLDYVIATIAALMIYIQIKEFFETNCFKAFVLAQPVCGKNLEWLLWVVVLFESAFIGLVIFRYFRWKRSDGKS